MSKIICKRKNTSFRDRVIINLFISIFLCSIITYNITERLSRNVLNYSKRVSKIEVNKLFKNAFQSTSFNEKTDDVIIIQKGKNGEILSLDFKISECYKILKDIMGSFNEELSKNNDKNLDLYIPLGFMSKNVMFLNIGPKIPVKINILEDALGSVKTKVSPYGLNNSLIEVYIEINVELSSSLPVSNEIIPITYSALISSKIVNGSIPNFYSGNLRKESSFPLSI